MPHNEKTPEAGADFADPILVNQDDHLLSKEPEIFFVFSPR
jgi:hypothetical protein